MLVGKEEHLIPLILASLQVRQVGTDHVEVTNLSDIEYRLSFDQSLHIFAPRKTTRITKSRMEGKSLTVENCYTGTNKKLIISVETLLNR